MNEAPLVVVGDLLLDVDVECDATRLAPDAPAPVLDERTRRVRPGGAGLAAALAARGERPVVLIAPVADDAAAREVTAALPAAVRLIPLPCLGSTSAKTRLRARGQTIARLDSGCGPVRVTGLPDDARAALRFAAAVLVADYGEGTTGSAALRELFADVSAPIVWDPHPRGAAPVPGAALVTPNAAEAARFCSDVSGSDVAAVRQCAETLRARWQARAVAVTMGAAGALLSFGDGVSTVVPAPAAEGGDTCGAGDCFAAAASAALAGGALPSEAVAAAVRAASGFVAAGGAAGLGNTPDATPAQGVSQQHAEEVVIATRSRGGTVVATGGCFDLLHAGHVATLAAARRLGDCLVVCLNSDESTRRRKGPSRPLQPERDRAAVLRSLRDVDAVVVFDEDTPVEVLRRLRPDVWVKGGDYAGADLPEAEVLREWGGEVVVVPYLGGRSTSRLVELAQR